MFGCLPISYFWEKCIVVNDDIYNRLLIFSRPSFVLFTLILRTQWSTRKYNPLTKCEQDRSIELVQRTKLFCNAPLCYYSLCIHSTTVTGEACILWANTLKKEPQLCYHHFPATCKCGFWSMQSLGVPVQGWPLPPLLTVMAMSSRRRARVVEGTSAMRQENALVGVGMGSHAAWRWISSSGL